MSAQLRYIKTQAKMLVVIILAITICIIIYIMREKKANYTELWRRVDKLEMEAFK